MPLGRFLPHGRHPRVPSLDEALIQIAEFCVLRRQRPTSRWAHNSGRDRFGLEERPARASARPALAGRPVDGIDEPVGLVVRDTDGSSQSLLSAVCVARHEPYTRRAAGGSGTGRRSRARAARQPQTSAAIWRGRIRIPFTRAPGPRPREPLVGDVPPRDTGLRRRGPERGRVRSAPWTWQSLRSAQRQRERRPALGCSTPPGRGAVGRAAVKGRSHPRGWFDLSRVTPRARRVDGLRRRLLGPAEWGLRAVVQHYLDVRHVNV